MTKRNGGNNFSVKKAFPSAVRITNSQGKRVWKLDDKEYLTKREMLNAETEESKKKKEVSDKPLTKTE
jgi:hypothetical protein